SHARAPRNVGARGHVRAGGDPSDRAHAAEGAEDRARLEDHAGRELREAAQERAVADGDRRDEQHETAALDRHEVREALDALAEDDSVAHDQETPIADPRPRRPVHAAPDSTSPGAEPKAVEPRNEAERALERREGLVDEL